jgi:citrate lyase beta subunit
MGFTGRLLVHPAQIGPTRSGFAPTPAEVRWARALLERADERRSAGREGGAWRFEGTMVDEAVLRQARGVLASLET